MFYDFKYKGIERKLPVYEVGGGLKIAYLDSFCDLELVTAFSGQMAAVIEDNCVYKSAEGVVILTAVSKGVPFAYSVAEKLVKGGKKIEIAIARKEQKKFFGNTVCVSKTSITSSADGDVLVLAENDVNKLRGAKVVVLDDMYSTGASINALEELAAKCNATVIDRVVAVWEVDDGSKEPPVKYCATLPLIK